MKWKLPLAAAAIVGAGAIALTNPAARSRASRLWRELSAPEVRADVPDVTATRTPTRIGDWDGVLALEKDQGATIGLKTAPVRTQAEPLQLRLIGATGYDPATLTIVRTMFDSRVDKVLVDLGQTVKKGDPLIELYSTDLADAKINYDNAVTQWNHDKKLLDIRTPLAKSDAIPKKELVEIQNDEAKSRNLMNGAKDKLLVYELSEAEVARAKDEVGKQKAGMTLRSKADGIVIKRDVVVGNFYEAKDSLMVIAPLDHFWVQGNVNEIDADRVRVGQDLRVVFPYVDRAIPGKVEYIDKAIDPDTRAAKFRTSVPNLNGRLKAGMFVRVLLDIPPQEGQTVIPRTAMVSVDQDNFVFVKKPGSSDRFERRAVFVAQENHDVVVLDAPSEQHPGVQPGEEVVTTGSLILEQMFEDRGMLETGSPL